MAASGRGRAEAKANRIQWQPCTETRQEITPAWQSALIGYERELSARRLSPNTLRAYSADLGELAAWAVAARHRRSPRARLPAAARLRRRARPDGLERSSVGRKLAAARGLFDYLTRAGGAAQNPAELLPNPQSESRLAARPRSRRGPASCSSGFRPRRRSRPATGRCSSSPTPRACAAPSSSASTSIRSTSTARPCGCAARAARSGSCRSASRRSVPSPAIWSGSGRRSSPIVPSGRCWSRRAAAGCRHRT